MEHPILFLDLLFGSFGIHIPPHVTYSWIIILILVGLGLLASRSDKPGAQGGSKRL